ncbi:MAG TPA: DoxX family protein [Kineosporiaceae bacterium]|nr:DoxX family protein [Kineosporiaceae bacterium]
MSIVLSLLLAVLCLLPAVAKLSGHPRMRHSAEHFGIPWKQYRLIGVAELAAAAGVLAGLRWPPLGIAAAVGMLLLLAGAFVMHRRAGDSPRDQVPVAVVLVAAVGYLAQAAAT